MSFYQATKPSQPAAGIPPYMTSSFTPTMGSSPYYDRQTPGYPPTETIVVMGIKVDDAETARCAKISLCLSIWCFILLFIDTILLFCIWSWLNAAMNILFLFTLPCCGYFGARNKDRSLLGSFNCNLLFAFVWKLAMWIAICIHMSRAARSYSAWAGWTKSEFDRYCYVGLGVIIIEIVLIFSFLFCFVYSYKLFKRLTASVILSPPPPPPAYPSGYASHLYAEGVDRMARDPVVLGKAVDLNNNSQNASNATATGGAV